MLFFINYFFVCDLIIFKTKGEQMDHLKIKRVQKSGGEKFDPLKTKNSKTQPTSILQTSLKGYKNNKCIYTHHQQNLTDPRTNLKLNCKEKYTTKNHIYVYNKMPNPPEVRPCVGR
jgi:hypothetical protein